jgi:hypothetical protein
MRSAVLAAVVGLALASPAVATDHFNSFNLSGNASPGAVLNAPLTAANSLEATVGYTLDQHDSGMITISIPGSTYVDNAAMISKGVGTVKLRFSALCTATSPATKTVTSVVLHMWDASKKEILSAQSPENVSLTFSCAATAASGKPDLVITSFGLSSWGSSCANGQTLFTFSVGVKNQGTGTWPAGPNRPAVVVADMHLPNPDDFGTGVAIDPPLAPGETRNLSIAVLYYSANPAHIEAGAPHPFHATVNRNHVIAESDFSNNDGPGPAVWNGMKVIQVGVPPACGKPPLQPHVVQPPGRIAVPTPTPVPIR